MPSPTIQTLASIPTPKEFHDKYVATRTPVIINTLKFIDNCLLDNLSKRTTRVQVESKDSVGNFGSGKARKIVSVCDFIKDLQEGNTNHYLTTQYGGCQTSIIQKPLEASDITEPSILGHLILQQVNLWMGRTETDQFTSSGLHHDFADNLYCLLQGRKRFTIIHPSLAPKLKTYGKIRNIFENGLISYDKNIRSDGAHIRDVLEYNLGKLQAQIPPPVDEIEQIEDEIFDLDTKPTKANSESINPPSFSRITPTQLHDPSFKLEKQEFILEAGQMLYLPASFFHEVQSLGDPCHVAVNFWYHPPSSLDFERPYQDDYWKETMSSEPLDAIETKNFMEISSRSGNWRIEKVG